MARLNREGVDRLFYKAPCLIITHLNPLEAVTPDVDPGLAASQMILMAETLGLGTCFIGFLIFALAVSEELREMLQIPGGHRIPLSFVAGYPDVEFLKMVSRNPGTRELALKCIKIHRCPNIFFETNKTYPPFRCGCMAEIDS